MKARKTEMFGITPVTNSKKFKKIFETYKNVAYLSLTSEKVPYSIIYYDNDGKNKNTGYVYIHIDTIINPSQEDLLDFLHEIGHIITNRVGMKRCMEEYLATQWAIDHAKDFGVKVSKKRIAEFQNYIFKWREIGIKHKAKKHSYNKRINT